LGQIDPLLPLTKHTDVSKMTWDPSGTPEVVNVYARRYLETNLQVPRDAVREPLIDVRRGRPPERKPTTDGVVPSLPSEAEIGPTCRSYAQMVVTTLVVHHNLWHVLNSQHLDDAKCVQGKV